MSKKNDYGISWKDFKYGIVLGAIAVVLYMFVNILDTWYPSYELAVIKTLIYLFIILASGTIIIDYIMVVREKKR